MEEEDKMSHLGNDYFIDKKIDEQQLTCQRAIHMTGFWGKEGKRKCGRNATHIQPGGLEVCEHHYNKYIKKLSKS